MKKLFSFLAVAVLCVMAISCGKKDSADASSETESAGKFESVANALKNKEWATADSLADIVYAGKANCSAEELANLGVAYFVLVGQSDSIDANQQLEYINRAIECCDAAETANADEAKEVYERSGKDIAGLKNKYAEKIPDFEKAAGVSSEKK